MIFTKVSGEKDPIKNLIKIAIYLKFNVFVYIV